MRMWPRCGFRFMMADGWHVCTLGMLFHRNGHRGPLDVPYTQEEERLWRRGGGEQPTLD